jgi:hypothetical protein
MSCLVIYKKIWNSFKKKILPKDPYQVTTQDLDMIESAYLTKDEYRISEKVFEDLSQEVWGHEEKEIMAFLKEMLKKTLSEAEWSELKDLEDEKFILRYMRLEKLNELKNSKDKEQVLRAFNHLVHIEGLKKEFKNNPEAENYYTLVYKVHALRKVSGHMYEFLKRMIHKIHFSIDQAVEKKEENLETLVKGVLKEVLNIMDEEIARFAHDLRHEKSPHFMGVDIDSSGMNQLFIEFKKLPQLLNASNLKTYIETKKKSRVMSYE